MKLVQVEGVIHFENDIEELQQWDHQVKLAPGNLLSEFCLNVFCQNMNWYVNFPFIVLSKDLLLSV
jgi:hypothetical protein